MGVFTARRYCRGVELSARSGVVDAFQRSAGSGEHTQPSNAKCRSPVES